jgi:sulfate permease, SulP family
MIKLPIIEWLPSYKKEYLKGDLVAGLTVGIMLIPQSMGYAMTAGLPPIYGLYASIVPLILYTIFGTSRHLSIGPVAMSSLLIAMGISQITPTGTETYIALALTLTLLVGIIQLLFGIFRLGFVVNFLSYPVVSGLTSAAALIIGFSQFKHLIGVEMEGVRHVHQVIISAIKNFDNINWLTFTIGIGGMVLIKVVQKYLPSIPSALLAVFFGIIITWVFSLTNYGVKIVGKIPTGLPVFGVPDFELKNLQALFSTAMTIALVSFMESISIAKKIESKHKTYKLSPNQELIALGLSKIGGSFFQSYVTTGGFSRTAVNDQCGAKTGVSSLISVGLVILTLLFLTPLFYYLPNAILASIIIVAVSGLVDIAEAKRLWKADRQDFWMLVATFVGSLSLGIEQGILLGIALSLGMVIYQSTKPHFAVLGKIPNKRYYKNLNRFPDLEDREDLLVVRFDARLYFANANYFQEAIETEIERKGDKLKLFILDADSINSMDSSGVRALDEIHTYCETKNIQFYMAGVKGPVRDVLHKSHLFEKIGEDHFFMFIQNGVDFFDEKGGQLYKNIVLEHAED